MHARSHPAIHIDEIPDQFVLDQSSSRPNGRWGDCRDHSRNASLNPAAHD
jgi:hypothetical protein